jgi:hypothetical protein
MAMPGDDQWRAAFDAAPQDQHVAAYLNGNVISHHITRWDGALVRSIARDPNTPNAGSLLITNPVAMAPPAIQSTNGLARIAAYAASLVTHIGYHDVLGGCGGDELAHRVGVFVHLVAARACLYDAACANNIHHTSKVSAPRPRPRPLAPYTCTCTRSG